ncbi:yjeF C-terminal region, hydroxyethylthiazole kinase-related [Micromonospora pallida]|uniref:ADP-dependent (S)-NAD(P)H-hydrate dehydratase n=1 Tax=Micromonospora pallida TaxID=145854 RepID=A0A1C6S457_9ACTN|nr:NAD(P)H-hydrate dehydratase [Micromonospora pallida]SCL24246.1 yjeF C-terminal region, hydroxyethylthiazole kinase-related [Micromonospora pallida]
MPNRSEPAVITPALLRDWALPVPVGGKETRGTVLVVGGSRVTPGAVLLAGVAALRAGAGVLQLAAAESTAAALSIQVPEALVVGLPETPDGAVAGADAERLDELVAEADVVAVGPGLHGIDETRALLHRVLAATGARTCLVLDAYALGALSHEPELLADAARPVVLTPNLTEARHLLGRDPGDDLDAEAAGLADRYRAVVSLYGHIASPDGRRWREESGDAGLGTSGSGDVRAGLLAGLMSRGAGPEQAACWAAYAHAVSGQRLVPRYGRIGFLARELLGEIPQVLATV